jgi:osmoprotectant transport system ATP-binding protein
VSATPEPAIELVGVGKRFGAVAALEDVSFRVGRGEICALIGPSGCGKTTTLKLINRVIGHESGVIRVRGQDIAAQDPVMLRRSIGYVIQHVGLFPHLSVGDNIGLPMRLAGLAPAERRRRAGELLELVGLQAAMLDRRPAQLSGGQQQRVGVARALAMDPDIILMDEPFGAVDPLLRPQLQRELRGIQKRLEKTIVLVTHDLAEAFALADRIVVMQGGRVLRHGTPREILLDPQDDFVRRFLQDVGSSDRLRLMRLTDLPRTRQASADDELVMAADISVAQSLDLLVSQPSLPSRIVLAGVDDGQGSVATHELLVAVARALRQDGGA